MPLIEQPVQLDIEVAKTHRHGRKLRSQLYGAQEVGESFLVLRVL